MPVIIKSSKEGFRRCGMPHSKAPVEWPDEKFTENELERLMAEPKLSVTIVPAEKEDAGKTTTQEGSHETQDGAAPGPEGGNAVAGDDTESGAADLAQDVLEAARQALASGDTIKSGAPDIKAMEKILGRDVDADERNRAWETLQAETEG